MLRLRSELLGGFSDDFSERLALPNNWIETKGRDDDDDEAKTVFIVMCDNSVV